MKVLVVSKVCAESSQKLVEALQAHEIDAHYLSPQEYEYGRYGAHILFAYGWSGYGRHNVVQRINQRPAVYRCIDKVETFHALQNAGVPVPAWTIRRKFVPKDWDHVVVRQDRTSCKLEGYAIIDQSAGEEIPNGDLYTQYFYNKYEYRVVVFKGEVFVYYKKPIVEDGVDTHVFVLKNNKNYPLIVEDAKKAAKALKIDYVGFDVVAQNKRSYRFLEANSGPILCDEVSDFIARYIKELV